MGHAEIAERAARAPRPSLDEPLPELVVGPRIFDRFLVAASVHPDAIAVVHSRGSWTYRQVEAASRALAAQLLALPGDSDVVALYTRRSGELVVAMLACARAGLTFALLDASYPIARTELQLSVLGASRFVAIGAADELAPALAQLTLPASPLRLDEAAMSALLASGSAAHDDRIDAGRPDAVAYLLFTSGTTGTPKCIATSHTPLVHFVDWYEQQFAVGPGSRFSLLTGVGHDPVLRDVFVPLSTGAAVHV